VLLVQGTDAAQTKACAAASFVLDLNGTGQLEAIAPANADAGASGFALLSGSALPLQTWTHVAVTWDGATASLYVGATRVAMTSATNGPVAGALDFLCLGQPTEASVRIDVDELRISRVARTTFNL
jgi:hypothetical protein